MKIYLFTLVKSTSFLGMNWSMSMVNATFCELPLYNKDKSNEF